MFRKKSVHIRWCIVVVVFFFWTGAAHAESNVPKENIYPVGKLKPRDSMTTLKAGLRAPDFTLPSVGGDKVTLSQYLGKKNVVISFIPAAWTPVCTYQWPAYDIARDIFDNNDAILLGISVDNIPTLYAWSGQMATSKNELWFPVLSDFFPHGDVAKKYGVLRSEGFTERALFVIDKKGIIQYIDIHDINERPPLMELREALEGLSK
jgi:peroxiredoxin